MNKNFFVVLLLFSLFFVSGAFADDINFYVVPENVPLNQPATATGVYTDSNVSGVLCSFYFLDAETQVILSRATDQYADGSGRFVMPGYVVREPVFSRGSLITLKSACGTAEADANFYVGQKQEVLPGVSSQGFLLDMAFFTNPENSFVLVMAFFIILILVASGLFFGKSLLGNNT